MLRAKRSKASTRPSDKVDLFIFYATISAIAAFGGSSRYDLMQVAILQPLLWLALAATILRARALRPFVWPLLLTAAFGLWLTLQLIPLPFSIWSELAGRGPIASADRQLVGEIWRPLSLVPSRTLNALGYLPAILAPMIAAINLGRKLGQHVVAALLGTAVISGLVGLVQEFSGLLYFYSITNQGRMVGLFANANHAALYGSMTIAVAGSAFLAMGKGWQRTVILAVAGFLFIAMIANGSRAGFATLIIATITFVICTWFSVGSATSTSSRGRPGKDVLGREKWRLFSVIAFAFLIGGLSLIFFMSDRIPAFENLAGTDPLNDLRFKVAPVLWEMAQNYFPWGVGIGAFEKAFYITEPYELLSHNYLNMAHNDILQFLIEGGLLAMLLLTAFLAVIGLGVRNATKHCARPVARSALIGVLGLGAIITVGSAFDYSLRTPIFQSSLAMLLILLYALPTLNRKNAP